MTELYVVSEKQFRAAHGHSGSQSAPNRTTVFALEAQARELPDALFRSEIGGVSLTLAKRHGHEHRCRCGSACAKMLHLGLKVCSELCSLFGEL